MCWIKIANASAQCPLSTAMATATATEPMSSRRFSRLTTTRSVGAYVSCYYEADAIRIRKIQFGNWNPAHTTTNQLKSTWKKRTKDKSTKTETWMRDNFQLMLVAGGRARRHRSLPHLGSFLSTLAARSSNERHDASIYCCCCCCQNVLRCILFCPPRIWLMIFLAILCYFESLRRIPNV